MADVLQYTRKDPEQQQQHCHPWRLERTVASSSLFFTLRGPLCAGEAFSLKAARPRGAPPFTPSTHVRSSRGCPGGQRFNREGACAADRQTVSEKRRPEVQEAAGSRGPSLLMSRRGSRGRSTNYPHTLVRATDRTFTWPEAQGPVSTVSCMGRGAAGTHASWQKGARA